MTEPVDWMTRANARAKGKRPDFLGDPDKEKMLSMLMAVIGEVSVLLNKAYGATVEATAPSVLRHAADGQAFLASDPEIGRLVAVGLAERLDFVTSYLSDLKHQYGDAPGLAMVSDVLKQLAQRQAPMARPGSARDPDPDY